MFDSVCVVVLYYFLEKMFFFEDWIKVNVGYKSDVSMVILLYYCS